MGLQPYLVAAFLHMVHQAGDHNRHPQIFLLKIRQHVDNIRLIFKGNYGAVFHMVNHVLTAFQIVLQMIFFLLIPLVAATAVAHGNAVVFFAELKEPPQFGGGPLMVDILAGHAEEYKIMFQVLFCAHAV